MVTFLHPSTLTLLGQADTTEAMNDARVTRRGFLGSAACTAAATVSTPAWALAMGSTSHVTSPAPGTLAQLSLAEASQLVASRQTTSTALVEAVLERVDIYNPKLNAFITVMRESALRQAAALDAEMATGRSRGPLHGIPIAVKDNIDTAGTRTTMASAVFDDRVPAEDAFVVRQLRQAGAVLIGKTNLHEFAMGGSSATSYFGPVRNPWALDRVPGGSSGGSAAAIITDLAFGALGTDTGGSICIPASYCSVVGLKPTYGLVSLRGIFPLIYSLDHCGAMARNVNDVGMLLTAMTGYDTHDVASVEHPREDYAAAMGRVDVSKLRLGIPREPFFDRLDEGIATVVEAALRTMSKLVQSTHDVQLPSVSALPWTAVRAAEVEAVHQHLFQTHGDSYSLQTHRVVEGTVRELNDLSQSGADRIANLVRASWELTLLRKNIDDAFSGFDLVALPTTRLGPRTITQELEREETPSPLEPEISFNSIAFNLYGIPALSVPCGFTSEGLPVGLLIAGPHFAEAHVLALGAAFEKATSFSKARPPMTPTTIVPPVARSITRPTASK